MYRAVTRRTEQSARQTVTNCACLTKTTTANNGDVCIKFLGILGQLKGLSYNHSSHFSTEVLVDASTVDCNRAVTAFEEDTRR